MAACHAGVGHRPAAAAAAAVAVSSAAAARGVLGGRPRRRRCRHGERNGGALRPLLHADAAAVAAAAATAAAAAAAAVAAVAAAAAEPAAATPVAEAWRAIPAGGGTRPPAGAIRGCGHTRRPGRPLLPAPPPFPLRRSRVEQRGWGDAQRGGWGGQGGAGGGVRDGERWGWVCAVRVFGGGASGEGTRPCGRRAPTDASTPIGSTTQRRRAALRDHPTPLEGWPRSARGRPRRRDRCRGGDRRPPSLAAIAAGSGGGRAGSNVTAAAATAAAAAAVTAAAPPQLVPIGPFMDREDRGKWSRRVGKGELGILLCPCWPLGQGLTPPPPPGSPPPAPSLLQRAADRAPRPPRCSS